MRFSPSPFRLLVLVPLIAVLSACGPLPSTPEVSVPTASPVSDASPTTEMVSETSPRFSIRPIPATSLKATTASPLPSATTTAQVDIPSPPKLPSPLPSTEGEAATMKVSLEVPGKTMEVRVKEQGTVYDLLVTARGKGFITFSGRQFSGVGFFVEEINGLRQDGRKGMYWIYAVNGKKANVGVSSSVVSEGDRVTFTYEAAN